jgi:NAD(P)H-dependent FMN reductase
LSRILGISGSLRKASYNTALLEAAVELAPAGTTIEAAGIHGIPLYDGDLEAAHGVPAAVTGLKERIAAADGLLLVTPEYNNSIPGPFKNAIDWLSRPANDIPRVFGGKPVALMGASPGRFGTLSAQTSWLPVFRVLGLRPWFATPLYVSAVHKALDGQHRLVDPDTRERLQKFLAGFAGFVG